MKSIITNMDFPKMQKALKLLGIEPYDAKNNMRPGMEVLEEMFRRVAQLDEKTQNEFSNIFGGGKFQANMSKALLDNADTMRELYTKIKQGNDELTAELLMTGMDTYQKRLQQLSASWQVLSGNIGFMALPALKEFTLALAGGVQWINEHREELSKLLSILGQAAEMLVIYRSSQFATNGVIAIGTGLLNQYKIMTLGTAEASFYGASGVRALGGAIGGIIGVAGLAIVKLAAFMTIAQALMNMASNASFEKDIEKSIGKERDNLDPNKNEMGEIERLYTERENLRKQKEKEFDPLNPFEGYGETDYDKKIEEYNEKIKNAITKRQLASAIKDANRHVDESKVNLGQHGKPIGDERVELGGSGKDKGGGAAYLDPYKPEETNIHRTLNDLLAQGKLATDEYSIAVENLSHKEKLFGVSANSVADSIELKSKRIEELKSYQTQLNTVADEYYRKAQEQIALDSDLNSTMQQYGLTVKDLTKEEYKHLTQNNQYINKLLDSYNKLRLAISDAKKDQVKLANEKDLQYFGDTQNVEKQLERRLKQISLAGRITQANINKVSPLADYESTIAKIKQLREQAVIEFEQIKIAEQNLANAIKKGTPASIQEWEDKLLSLQATNAETQQKIRDEVYKTNIATKQLVADTLVDLIVEGKSFEDIMKKIWHEIAKEAIYAMLGIKQSASMLQGIMGAGKKKGGVKVPAAPSAFNMSTGRIGTMHSGGMVPSYPKMHSGGIVPYLKNDEVVRTLQSGEEVVSRRDRSTNEMLIELVKSQNEKQNSAQPIVVYAMDAQSVAEFFNRNGDVMAAVLRKEKAMGNRI